MNDQEKRANGFRECAGELEVLAKALTEIIEQIEVVVRNSPDPSPAYVLMRWLRELIAEGEFSDPASVPNVIAKWRKMADECERSVAA